VYTDRLMLITDAPPTELSYDSEEESSPENLNMLSKDDCKKNIDLSKWFRDNSPDVNQSIA
jgi:hypothetical protein